MRLGPASGGPPATAPAAHAAPARPPRRWGAGGRVRRPPPHGDAGGAVPRPPGGWPPSPPLDLPLPLSWSHGRNLSPIYISAVSPERESGGLTPVGILQVFQSYYANLCRSGHAIVRPQTRTFQNINNKSLSFAGFRNHFL